MAKDTCVFVLKLVGISFLLLIALFIIGAGSFLLWASGASNTCNQQTIYTYAHRGHTQPEPENSKEAMSAAVTAGKGPEMDVTQLSDGTLILFHDDNALDTTG